MRCDHLEPLIEAIAEGGVAPDPADAAHLAACPVCSARLAHATAIERLLATRDVPQPPGTFTSGVMALVGRDRWQTERVVDLGFNLAIAAGVLLILAGGVGLLWSLGFWSVSIDLGAVVETLAAEFGGRVVAQAQMIALSALLLTTALGLWWWVETESAF